MDIDSSTPTAEVQAAPIASATMGIDSSAPTTEVQAAPIASATMDIDSSASTAEVQAVPVPAQKEKTETEPVKPEYTPAHMAAISASLKNLGFRSSICYGTHIISSAEKAQSLLCLFLQEQ